MNTHNEHIPIKLIKDFSLTTITADKPTENALREKIKQISKSNFNETFKVAIEHIACYPNTMYSLIDTTQMEPDRSRAIYNTLYLRLADKDICFWEKDTDLIRLEALASDGESNSEEFVREFFNYYLKILDKNAQILSLIYKYNSTGRYSDMVYLTMYQRTKQIIRYKLESQPGTTSASHSLYTPSIPTVYLEKLGEIFNLDEIEQKVTSDTRKEIVEEAQILTISEYVSNLIMEIDYYILTAKNQKFNSRQRTSPSQGQFEEDLTAPLLENEIYDARIPLEDLPAKIRHRIIHLYTISKNINSIYMPLKNAYTLNDYNMANELNTQFNLIENIQSLRNLDNLIHIAMKEIIYNQEMPTKDTCLGNLTQYHSLSEDPNIYNLAILSKKAGNRYIQRILYPSDKQCLFLMISGSITYICLAALCIFAAAVLFMLFGSPKHISDIFDFIKTHHWTFVECMEFTLAATTICGSLIMECLLMASSIVMAKVFWMLFVLFILSIILLAVFYIVAVKIVLLHMVSFILVLLAFWAIYWVACLVYIKSLREVYFLKQHRLLYTVLAISGLCSFVFLLAMLFLSLNTLPHTIAAVSPHASQVVYSLLV
ncbi:hypothetical protein NEOKW01_2119 [Nematocida sp. AWRm80]|nr:hypothetical protein NEOKW01_2119 [Nematocida sp. AWRm80]